VANDSSQQKRGPSDPTDYSASKAPETQDAAEPYELSGDPRLHPGGAHGSPTDPGMSSLNHDQQPAGASGMRMEDFGSTKDIEP
jgi:hypothetical protein